MRKQKYGPEPVETTDDSGVNLMWIGRGKVADEFSIKQGCDMIVERARVREEGPV